MSDRLHRQDLRAIGAFLLLASQRNWDKDRMHCAMSWVDWTLTELERTAKPECTMEDRPRAERMPAKPERVDCRDFRGNIQGWIQVLDGNPEAAHPSEELALCIDAIRAELHTLQTCLREANDNRMKMIGLVDSVQACFPDEFHPELTLAGKIVALAGESRAEGAREERERLDRFLRHLITCPGYWRKDGRDAMDGCTCGLRAALESKP